jgi:exodeoxyribonuclease VII large subunit
LCFDSYHMALNIAQFPLPVLTGIGHERDLSIADMVAHQHLKTPTAVAEFIIAHNLEFEMDLNQSLETIADAYRDRISAEKENILSLASDISKLSTRQISHNKQTISLYFSQITSKSRSICKTNRNQLKQFAELLSIKATQPIKSDILRLQYIKKNLQLEIHQAIKTQKSVLNNFEKQNYLFNPITILNKGYSITYLNNKVLMHADDVKPGDKIKTMLKSGTISSKVD